MSLFENYQRRIEQITPILQSYGADSLEQAQEYCLAHGVDPQKIVRETQPIAFDDAAWAYTLGPLSPLKRAQKQQPKLPNI
nr:GGGtGRT protein [Dongshaea marina]